MKINGLTQIIAHIGYPTHSFKAPMIYNPYFEHAGINALVVPMACQSQHYEVFLKAIFSLGNVQGALITMPHKVSTVAMLDQQSAAVKVAGACNAVKRGEGGELIGDMFDGAGFTRGVLNKGFKLRGARALVIGAGGVGSAIAASLAGEGVSMMRLFDAQSQAANTLGARLKLAYPNIEVECGLNDASTMDLVVNATPLGMNAQDPLPTDMHKISASTFVGEVVMTTQMTPFLTQAKRMGCTVQVGTDMLFEQIPAYLEFFGLPPTDAASLRSFARIEY